MTGVPADTSRIRQGIAWNRSMRKALWAIPLFLCGWLWCTPSGQQQIPNMTGKQQREPFGGFGDQDGVFAVRQIRALNADRQKSMVSDTEKLLKLAKELNEEIADGNGEALSAVQVRKLAEIEKLAHNVKQKMSFSIAGGPAFHDIIVQPSP
jgi:hypothetical protein